LLLCLLALEMYAQHLLLLAQTLLTAPAAAALASVGLQLLTVGMRPSTNPSGLMIRLMVHS
jgi:hypothetical protein